MALRYLTGMVFVIAAWSALAQDTYTLDPSHTVPSFEVRHIGISTQRGFFTRTSGTVTLDRATHAGTIDAVIDAASIDTGESLRDRFLRGGDFLDVQHHAVIGFRASKIAFQGEVPVAAEGTLELRGVARPVTLAIEGFACTRHPLLGRDVCGATVRTAIKRSEFGMTAWAHDVGDDIAIAIQVEATRDEAPNR